MIQAPQAVILIEGYWCGHTPTYCKLLVAAFLHSGVSVKLLCPYPDEVLEYLRSDETSIENLDTHAIPRFEGPLHRIGWSTEQALAYMTPVFSYLDQHPELRRSENLVYVSVADLLFDSPLALRTITRRLAMPWGGLYMQPLPRSLASYPRLKTRLLARCWRLLSGRGPDFITTLDLEMLEQSTLGIGRKILPFPDVTDEAAPAPEHPLAQELRAFADGRKVVGLLGNIAPWKGAHSFLDCVENWKDDGEACFALCGPLVGATGEQTAIRHRVDQSVEAGRPLFVRWGRIDDGVPYNSLFASLNLFWAHYPGHHHSSNNLTKAAMLKVPVICGKHGLMAERVEKYGLGKCFEFSHADQIAKGVRDMLRASGKASPGMGDYFEVNSQAALNQVVGKILGACVS